jgi:hypothetical protein
MADKIERASTFDGTVEFVRYGRLDSDKKTPYIEYKCTDSESGKVAYGKWFATDKSLPYTVKRLRQLGVDGATDAELLGAISTAGLLDCTFDTVPDKKGYINADNVRGRGAAGGLSDGMDKDEWLSAVFGGEAKSPADAEDSNLPF